MENQKNSYKRGFLPETEFVEERISKYIATIKEKKVFLYYGEYSIIDEKNKKQLMAFQSKSLEEVKEFIKSKPAFYKYGR